MFGAVRAYEGCALFREAIGKHPKFKDWYERMQHCLVNGYSSKGKISAKKHFFSFLTSSESDEMPIKETQQTNPSDNLPTIVENNSSKPSKNLVALVNQATNTDTPVQVNEKLTPSEATLLRVLAINYLAHLAVFTYAGWMGK